MFVCILLMNWLLEMEALSQVFDFEQFSGNHKAETVIIHLELNKSHKTNLRVRNDQCEREMI